MGGWRMMARVRSRIWSVRTAAVALLALSALLGLAGAPVEGIREALSHQMALKQCGRFFAEHPNIRAVEAHDTAGEAPALPRKPNESRRC